ncbi:MAG TPA: protein translocase subunit SecD [Bryobacteraceae bacterium]|nr:protein translocase subunit SecD [Bryobacteraceae bacterium]
MYKNLKLKGLIILAVLLACTYSIIGLPKSKDELMANFQKNIRLGLDLRGGSHLVLQVQVQDAFKADADQAIERMKDEMAKQGITHTAIERNDPGFDNADKIEITVKGVPLDKTGPFRTLAADYLSQYNMSSINSTDYRFNMKPTEALAVRRQTVIAAINTIEKRINGLGLAESTVRQRGRSDGEAEVLVEMPGVDDPARIKQILQTAAMLEITSVQGGPFSTPEQAMTQNNGVLPLNTKLAKSVARGAGDIEGWYIVSRTAVVTGRDLRNARAGRDEMGKASTDFTLSQDGGRKFGRYTEQNIGQRLAILLDGQIRSVATIQSRIEDSGQISNIGTEQEAADLALVLRAGSLPASVIYLEERTVGPSLGADSIRQGFIAGMAGLIAVVAIMLVYYKKAGINATIALIINAIVLIGILAWFEAVLTLPGIAGIILTIGMAVDSNVLIFERIREELRAGKAIPAAIDAGFDRAFLTIIDTHVTTIVSCAFLFIFGNSAVKGFAVSLVIGLAANVFTAVFISRAIFQWELNRNPKMQELSI